MNRARRRSRPIDHVAFVAKRYPWEHIETNNVSHWFFCACFASTLAGCSGPELILGGGGDSDCVPGVYAGTYDCSPQGPDASALTSGPLSLRLEGDVGGKVLNIASGTKIATTQAGIEFSAELSGSVDCATNRLKGTMSNVTSSSKSFTFVVNGTGDISAGYDGRSSPPALVDGVLEPPGLAGLPEAGLGALMGTCTWTATLR